MTWKTPAFLVDKIAGFSEIGLDPCTDPTNPVGAKSIFIEANNGLDKPWINYGLVYVNPPYGRGIKLWADKIVNEADHGAEIIALTAARTDARWFQKLLFKSQSCCIIRGRLRFEGAESSAPFPSSLFYFGTKIHEFDERFSEIGMIVRVHFGKAHSKTS